MGLISGIIPALDQAANTRADAREKLETISAFQDRPCCTMLLASIASCSDLSVHATAMFRHPSFYLTFRKRVVPLLRNLSDVQSGGGLFYGEEVYSLAILPRGEHLYGKCRSTLLTLARRSCASARGNFSVAAMRDYTANYHKAGALMSFPTTTPRSMTV